MGGKVSKNVESLEPLTPTPTSDELSEIGGRYFTRPSDGRKLEYFILNGGGSGEESPKRRAIVNLVCTNATGRMYHIWKPDEVTDILKKEDAMLINVSTAGVGPSEPYGSRLNDITPTKYLEQTSQDVIALLKEMGVSEAYTMGISGGWEPSAHLAATLLSDSENDNIKLKGVSCVRGIPWMTKDAETEPLWVATFGTGWKKSLGMWFVNSADWINPHLMNMMFPAKPEQMKAYMPDYDEVVAAIGEELVTEMTTEGNRANAHWLFVASFLGQLTCSSERNRPAMLADLNMLQEAPLVNLHMSVNDKMVPHELATPYLKRKIPNARLHEDDQSHIAVPFVEAVAELLSPQKVSS